MRHFAEMRHLNKANFHSRFHLQGIFFKELILLN